MISEMHQALTLPPLHSVLETYRAELAAVAKPAWLLKCHTAEAVSRFGTHIAGETPFVPVEEGWPICDRCRKPMTFIWQVDFADFGGIGAFATRGLFQFFYCWDCFILPQDGLQSGWRWYSDFDARRVADVPQQDAPRSVKEGSRRVGPFDVEIIPFLSVPAKCAVENPIPHEVQNERVDDEGQRLWAVYSFTKGLYLEEEMISRIGGYPPWVQFEDDTPRCPVCGEWAEFVGAVGSDDTGLIWGDSGYWYFFACKATEACYGLARPLMVTHCY